MKKNNNFRSVLKYIGLQVGCLLIILLTASCDTDVTKLTEPPDTSGKTPIIESVDPPDEALAGITVLTITGQNFSPVKENNLVRFHGIDNNIDPISEVLEASTTQLKVRVPLLIEDSVMIRIAISGDNQSNLFDDPYYINLIPAVTEVRSFLEEELPYALTTDNMGNIFISYFANKFGRGIYKITPDGQFSEWAKKGGETFFRNIRMGADNTIYGVRSVQAVFEIKENIAAKPFAILPGGTSTNLVDLDIDENQNIWTGGNNDVIFCVTPEKVIKSFPFDGNVRALSVHDGFLYAAAVVDSLKSIFRFQIFPSDSIGAAELYYTIPSDFVVESFKMSALTLSAAGNLFIGTDLENPIILVRPDKSYEYFYPGVVTPNVYSFSWGAGKYLYYTRESDGNNAQTVLRVDMQEDGVAKL